MATLIEAPKGLVAALTEDLIAARRFQIIVTRYGTRCRSGVGQKEDAEYDNC